MYLPFNLLKMQPLIMQTLVMLTAWSAIVATSPASAEQRPDTLRLAVIDDVPSTHMAYELVRAAYDQLGITVETVVVPSRRALALADAGGVDGDLFRIKGMADQYANLVQVPYPLLQGRLLAVVRDDSDIQTIETSSRPLTVAIRRGVIIAERAAKSEGMSPQFARNYRQIRQMLDWGRVDVGLVSDIEGHSPLNNPEWDHLRALPVPVAHFTLFHYVHRRHEHLVKPLAEALEKLHNDGEKRKIFETALHRERASRK
ncbi:substrate-binding periplasmic protein [Marinobacter sp.]|uniref:substrate-binding periplasmic protein n=1 Tax=Marinobacter sp. TaxID=50741 RepID=UPI0034A3597D